MSDKHIVESSDAPAPIGPYSQAVSANGFLFVSGQIALDPENGTLVMENIEAETKQVMKNLEQILIAAGLNFSHVIKSSIFLSKMNDFPIVNRIYGARFPENPPARETIEVSALPKGVNVEISVIALDK